MRESHQQNPIDQRSFHQPAIRESSDEHGTSRLGVNSNKESPKWPRDRTRVEVESVCPFREHSIFSVEKKFEFIISLDQIIWKNLIKICVPSEGTQEPRLGIFRAQNWDTETITWFCVMVGRLLLPHNALNDNWNVWPFLFGPGSGKHVLLHLITQMMGGRDHVFEQGAHTAGNFGKSVGMSQGLDKKHCFILSRVDGNCNMRQSTLANMICGDVIDMSLKLQGMTPIQWDVQGICSGHEFFQDDNLTLIRRFVPFPFFKHVNDGDRLCSLRQDCEVELPDFIRKCGLLLHQKLRHLNGANDTPSDPNTIQPLHEISLGSTIYHDGHQTRWVADTTGACIAALWDVSEKIRHRVPKKLHAKCVNSTGAPSYTEKWREVYTRHSNCVF